MIKIDKDFNNVPKVLLRDDIVNDLLINKSKHTIKNIYSHSDVKEELVKKLYNNKCAYCERKLYTGYEKNNLDFLNIDHFRPKAVYYWLIYEWSNLIPSCKQCNTTKKHYFPISNKRVTFPQKNKKALLIHPEIDNPSEHLYFNNDWIIEFKSLKGEITINIIGLNREDLYGETKK